MHPWSRATLAQYRGLSIRAHDFLADVPVHDIWRVALPGVDRTCTMEDVRAVAQAAGMSQKLSLPVRILFAIRRIAGRLFRWDIPQPESLEWSYRTRLTELDRRKSLVEAGTLDGPFSVLYVHPTEAVSEIRNATVHAFLVWALDPAPGGHQLFFAIYVLPVSRWTPLYMAVIAPFRRWFVYPALLRRFYEAWCSAPTSAA